MGYVQKITTTKKAEILLVGNELLIGKTRDLNAFWLGKHLSSFGITVQRVTVIRDDVDAIAKAINELIAREPDYIFTSGGIGPTFDDQTLQGIAGGLKCPLELNETALEWIIDRYAKGHKNGTIKEPGLNPARKKMAYIPRGSVPLRNTAGTAPGVSIKASKTSILILPGVPRELQAIFENEIAPILQRENQDIMLHEFSFIVNGVGESTMAEKIESLMQRVDARIWIKSHARSGPLGYYVLMHVSGYGDREFRDDVKKVADESRSIIISLGGTIQEDHEENE
nr:molybdopterin-binding protein [Candidatus Sigynarchaeota archaeon]